MGDRLKLRVQVVRVFCDGHDDHGNPLGIVLDGQVIPRAAERQEVAFELGFSETVFVDDRRTAALQIFTPKEQLPLAGHPLVGTAWELAQQGTPVSELRPPAGPVACGLMADGGGAWIEADPSRSPYWKLTQLATPAEVEALDAESYGENAHDYLWAWSDEPAGRVRARSFASGKGVGEDEATGSAALVLCAAVGRAI